MKRPDIITTLVINNILVSEIQSSWHWFGDINVI